MTKDIENCVNRQQLAAIERYTATSALITNRCIYIGFGLIGLCFSLLSSDSSAILIQSLTSEIPRLLLVFSAIFGILTVLCDYLQHLCNFLLFSKAVKNKKDGYKYRERSFSYCASQFFFGLKQLMAIVGTALVLIAVVLTIY